MASPSYSTRGYGLGFLHLRHAENDGISFKAGLLQGGTEDCRGIPYDDQHQFTCQQARKGNHLGAYLVRSCESEVRIERSGNRNVD